MGMRKSVVAAVLMAAGLLVIGVYGQQGRSATPDKSIARKKAAEITNKPGETTYMLVTSSGPQERTKITISSTPSVIIKLKDEPISRHKEHLKDLDNTSRDKKIKEHQDKIKAAHDEVKEFIRSHHPGHNGKYKEFETAFNGLATEVSEGVVEQLKGHPAVEAVYPDVEVQASLTESVPLIGANTMWTTYGATGMGMRVAVIDTGIDYRHPDLGAGFGPTYKVIGGYDFVNKDADPLDDNGHGTHVAGIIGANGTLKGVAPDVKLLAYKVLAANGYGKSSDIMAGINRALDPDQNPSTNDAAHVISMSLGGYGTPDDPMSQAVDNAVNSGVICVIAAGNSGDYGYFTVGSPGVARKAITVGASDKSDVMASFSSKGPVDGTWAIKPDVTAPGVSINSTSLNNSYAVLSGTSMATPHVAGVVALLRQLHPTWTAEEMKAVLIEKGKNINVNAFTQGGGRVQPVASHNAQAVITPGSVSFGMDDQSVSVWTSSQILTIKNLTGTSNTYGLSVQGSLPAGVTWSVVPSTVTLAPNASQTVTFTLSVNNAVVLNSPNGSKGYDAKLVATSSAETLTVPFAFLKALYLRLNFDVAPVYVWINNRIAAVYGGYSYWASNPGTSVTVLVNQASTYDIVVGYDHDPTGAYNPQTRVFREGVYVGGSSLQLSLSRSEASNQVTMRALDANAQELPWTGLSGGTGTWGVDSLLVTRFVGGLADFVPTGILSAGDAPRNTFYFSNVSSNYEYDFKAVGLSQQTNGAYYDFAYPALNGITQSQTLSNSTSFKHVTHRHTVPAGVSKVFLIPGVGHAEWWYPVAFFRYESAFTGDVFTPPSSDVVSAPFVREAYYSIGQTSYWNRHNQFLYQYNGSSFGDGDDPILYQTAWFGAPNTTTLDGFRSLYDVLMSDSTTPESYFSTTASEMAHNMGPHKWSGRAFSDTVNNQPRLSIYPEYGWAGVHFYWSQLADLNWAKLNYDIYQGSTRITGGVIDPLAPVDLTASLPAPGMYTVKIPYNGLYSINGKTSNAVGSMTVDTTKSETQTPMLTDLKIFSNGTQTDTTDRANATNQIKVAFGDWGSNINQASVSFSASNNWVSLGSFTTDGSFTVDVPKDMITGYYNLKVSAQDTNGNSMAYEMTPGFYHRGFNAYLRNISTRGYVGTGMNAMIGGFIIAGTEPKTVLIRAKGPSLVDSGVTGVLADPTMNLYSGSTIIARNNNWQTTDTLWLSPIIWHGTSADILATGMQPTGTNSTRESAILVTLPPGAYTAIVTGVSNGVGVGLVSVNEVASYPSSSRLRNISSRGYVGTGMNAMIGGFIIAGTEPKKVLIRAKGPSLVDNGVTGVLADPTMKLYSGSTVIAQNNDWQTDDPLQLSPIIWKGTAADILATGLQPTGTNSYRESAILVTLPPGAYTAIVTGVNNGMGVGLVSVNEVQ